MKKYLRYNVSNAILFLMLFSAHGQVVYAQDNGYPSLFYNSDNYLYYRIDTIERNEAMLNSPSNYRDTSFLIYSIVKLWNEDTCGHKGYRINLANFLKKTISEGNLILYKKDVIYHFGKPFDMSEYDLGKELRKGDDKSKFVAVPVELDKDFQELRYPLVKDKDCISTKEFVEFRIDKKNDQVYSIGFLSDFFETETDVER